MASDKVFTAFICMTYSCCIKNTYMDIYINVKIILAIYDRYEIWYFKSLAKLLLRHSGYGSIQGAVEVAGCKHGAQSSFHLFPWNKHFPLNWRGTWHHLHEGKAKMNSEVLIENSWVAQLVKNPPAMRETWVRSLEVNFPGGKIP